MPNHITNELKLIGEQSRIDRLLNEIKLDEGEIGTIDFNKIIPMPESLNIECGSRTDRGLNAYRAFTEVYPELTGSKDLLNIPEKAESDFIKHLNDIDPEEWELGKTAFRNILLYGAPSWYDWRLSNWGTKWNSYSPQEMRDNILIFDTAWSNAQPVIQRLSEKYPDIQMSYKWADEDIGYNVGEYVFKGGERTEENIPEGGSKEALEMAAEIKGIDLSEYGYVFSEESGNYEYEGFEQTM